MERAWTPGPILTRGGTNTRSWSVAWIAPGRGEAWLAVTNAGTPEARDALDRLVARAVERSPGRLD